MTLLSNMQITYSSDYFEQLYQLSLQLIKGGHAYVDHQTADEIKLSRWAVIACVKLHDCRGRCTPSKECSS